MSTTPSPLDPAYLKASTSSNDDIFQNDPKEVNDESTPYFIQRPQTQTVPVTRTLDNGTPASAYVDAQHPSTVAVQDPAAFNGPMAAHEDTHTWQYGRNPDFTDNLGITKAHGTNAGDYDYGGVAGLHQNHPSIGNLNAEQQASIVGDLTKENMTLEPYMKPADLSAWDAKKAALERPIQQMQNIPAAAPPTMISRADDMIHKVIPSATRPLQYLHDLVSPPKLAPSHIPAPEVPSAPSGYAVPSNYVRGGEQALPKADYGGIDGLAHAQASQKTIADFNPVQRATMVQDYKAIQDQYLQKQAQGALTPADHLNMQKAYSAYHPFVQQMVPTKKISGVK